MRVESLLMMLMLKRFGVNSKNITVEDEMEVIRKIRDPKLPSQEAIEEHWIGGHMVYRDWCEVSIQARGKEDPHKRDNGKDRRLPECLYDSASREMRWVISGQSWWDRKGHVGLGWPRLCPTNEEKTDL